MDKMPRARTSGLIVKEADGELLIYDLERNKAHCLNASAAKIWQQCDGQNTVAQVCTSLSADLHTTCDEKVVWYALNQFAKDNLLEEEVPIPAFMVGGMNRRQMVRTLGLTAAIAVPLVTSILAPSAVQAATLFPPGSPCTAPIGCASGVCCSGTNPACVGIPPGTCL